MFDVVKDSTAEWCRKPPAGEAAIEAFLKKCGIQLPADYIAFLRLSNGGEGMLGIEPGGFRVWAVEEVTEANDDYEVRSFLPNHFAFGTDGGDEMFAFDLVDVASSKVYMIPFITMEADDARLVADSFESFVSAMGRDL